MKKETEAELVTVETTTVENEGREHVPTVGHYYWYTYEDEVRVELDQPVEYVDEDGDIVVEKYRNEKRTIEQLCCITHIGSNYAKIQTVGLPNDRATSWRIHFDGFWDCCRRELDPDGYIKGQIAKYERKVRDLMLEVGRITQQLAVGVAPEAGAGDTMALAVVSGQPDVKAYQRALVKAKQEELPAVFEEIKAANEMMASWMKAKTLPLKAQSDGLKHVIDVIDGRIFNVELYAGLVEEITQIADGAPAAATEKIHLMQRRHYMDEECLFAYQHGGMEFKNLRHFDKWLARPRNRDRILPFPRTIAAFRVRRTEKDRGPIGSFGEYIQMMELREADKKTFLYIRNGERLFRLETELDFDEKLFPDLDHHILKGGEIYARDHFGWELISAGDYEEQCRAYDRESAEFKAECAAWDALSKEEQEARREIGEGRPWWGHHDDPHHQYQPFTPESVYYDDIGKAVSDELKKHNRIVVIVQGLLDRSEALLPHPPWSLWTEEGFRSAIELVFDSDRVLTPGAKPDFEAYRAELNKHLAVGSVTIGQEDAWELWEGEKESARRERDGRYSYRERDIERHRPYGNPGPGLLAEVKRFSKSKKQCTYTWTRERQRRRSRYDRNPSAEEIETTFTCDASKVLNVSAYKPGDYRRFFADPRTRAEYLEWAPLLLAAEEYHAGNLHAGASRKERFKRKSALTAEELASIPPDPEEEAEKAERAAQHKRFFGTAHVEDDGPPPAELAPTDTKTEPEDGDNPYDDDL